MRHEGQHLLQLSLRNAARLLRICDGWRQLSLFGIPTPPTHQQLHSFITELLSELKRYLKTEVAAEREQYSDKHLLVVLNLMQFITSCVFLCAKSHLFSFSNRIWSRFAFGCFRLLHTLNVLVYSSLIWMLHIFYFLFLLACLPLENEFWRQSLCSCHDKIAMVYFKCYFLLYYLPFYTQTPWQAMYSEKKQVSLKLWLQGNSKRRKNKELFFTTFMGFFFIIVYYHHCGRQFVCTKADYWDSTRSILFILPGPLARMSKSSISQNGSFAFILFNTRHSPTLSILPTSIESITVSAKLHSNSLNFNENQALEPTINKIYNIKIG